MKKIIIFGNSMSAKLISYHIENETNNKVVAYTVESKYLKLKNYNNLPIYPFESIHEFIDVTEMSLCIPIGIDSNDKRKEIFRKSRNMFKEIYSFISKNSLISNNVSLGSGVVIYEGSIIQPFSKIGSNVIIRSGVNISHHVSIGNNVFIAPSACICGGAKIMDDVIIGAGAIIKDQVIINASTIVGAGSLVLEDTIGDATYFGVPAKIST